MNSHSCNFPDDGYQRTCLEPPIRGKVLEVKLTTDKFDKTDEPCLKIRINEWKDLSISANRKYAVYYGIKTYYSGEKTLPEKGRTYQFFLHEIKGIDQKGWQWTHDWQLDN